MAAEDLPDPVDTQALRGYHSLEEEQNNKCRIYSIFSVVDLSSCAHKPLLASGNQVDSELEN